MLFISDKSLDDIYRVFSRKGPSLLSRINYYTHLRVGVKGRAARNFLVIANLFTNARLFIIYEVNWEIGHGKWFTIA